MKKVYALELWGDIACTPGSVRLEVAGLSLDRSVLEKLKEEKDRELKEYLKDEVTDTDSDDEGDEEEFDEDDEGSVTYMNFDLSFPPTWEITEYDLL